MTRHVLLLNIIIIIIIIIIILLLLQSYQIIAQLINWKWASVVTLSNFLRPWSIQENSKQLDLLLTERTSNKIIYQILILSN